MAIYLKRPNANAEIQQQVELQLELQIEQKDARISQLEKVIKDQEAKKKNK